MKINGLKQKKGHPQSMEELRSLEEKFTGKDDNIYILQENEIIIEQLKQITQDDNIKIIQENDIIIEHLEEITQEEKVVQKI